MTCTHIAACHHCRSRVTRLHQQFAAAQPLTPVKACTPGERDLSVRELQVIALVADGLSRPQVAARLGIAQTTVKTHLARATTAAGATGTTALVAIALRRGWIR